MCYFAHYFILNPTRNNFLKILILTLTCRFWNQDDCNREVCTVQQKPPIRHNRKLINDFLLVINSNLPPTLHRFRDTAFDRSKIAIFGYPFCV